MNGFRRGVRHQEHAQGRVMHTRCRYMRAPDCSVRNNLRIALCGVSTGCSPARRCAVSCGRPEMRLISPINWPPRSIIGVPPPASRWTSPRSTLKTLDA